MEELKAPGPMAIDLSQSMFRGSGALYQSDRLSLGRSKSPMTIPGKEQVIEKVVHVVDNSSAERLLVVESRLEEALLRLVLANVERDRLARKVAVNQRSAFEGPERLENRQLQAEVARLRELIKDKEREAKSLREAEIRASAVQTGDLVQRLQVVAQENRRLQQANNDRIIQVNTLTTQLVQTREALAKHESQTQDQSQVDGLQKELQFKSNEIKSLRGLVASLEKEKSTSATSQKALQKELVLIKTQMAEVSTANEDLFRINTHLEKELEKATALMVRPEELTRLKEANTELSKNLEVIRAANLNVRDEMARQKVSFAQREASLTEKAASERRDSELKMDSLNQEIQRLTREMSDLSMKLETVSRPYLEPAKRSY